MIEKGIGGGFDSIEEDSVREYDGDVGSALLNESSYVSAYGGRNKAEAIVNNKRLCEGIVRGDIPSLSVFHGDTQNQKPWENTSMSLLETWLRACSIRSQVHLEKSYLYRKRAHLISVPEVLVGGVATGMAFWSVGSGEGSPRSVSLLVAVLSSVSMVLKSLETVFNFTDISNKHVKASDSYSELCRKIEVNVFTPTHLRQNAQLFLEEVSLKYSQTLSSSPPINITHRESP